MGKTIVICKRNIANRTLFATIDVIVPEGIRRKGGSRNLYQEESFKTELAMYTRTRSDAADIEYKMHCHNSYEIYYMIAGNVTYFLEGTSYRPRPGSLIVIPPNCFHGLQVMDDSEYYRIRIHFVPELLNRQERDLILGPLASDWNCFEEQFAMEWYFHALEECGSYKKEVQDIAIRTQVLAVLIKIFAICSAQGPRKGKEGQIQDIIGYINENLALSLTLEGLAEQFFMSKNHLTAIFKRATGTTVAKYILYKRMALVRGELLRGVPAAEAVARAGFGDYSSFFRAYKKIFGAAPSDRKAAALPDMDRSGAF